MRTSSFRRYAHEPTDQPISSSDADSNFGQAYLFFWDKLNKANYYLELSIENADLPIDDRLVAYLADDPITDGGQWDMVVNLVEVSLINTIFVT